MSKTTKIERNISPLILLALAIAAAFGITWVVVQPSADAASNSKAVKDVADLRAEVERLRDEQQSATREIGWALQSNARVQATNEKPTEKEERKLEPATSGDPELDSNAEQAKAEQLVREDARRISEAFEKEPADPKWSQEAVRDIEKAYAIPQLSSMKYTAKCRTSFCRVDFQFERGSEEAREGLKIVMNRPPWQEASGFVSIDASGNGAFYLSREGYDLPIVRERQ